MYIIVLNSSLIQDLLEVPEPVSELLELSLALLKLTVNIPEVFGHNLVDYLI